MSDTYVIEVESSERDRVAMNNRLIEEIGEIEGVEAVQLKSLP